VRSFEETNLIRDPAIRVVLLPKDTNAHGTIFGGIILSHIDLAGTVEVGKITDQMCVTKAVKEVIFKEPVRVGELVSFYSSLVKIGSTSVTVHIDVEVLRDNKEVQVTEADVVYVCIDHNKRPTPVVHRVAN
jgi:acyl-CoA thioesterase YciA